MPLKLMLILGVFKLAATVVSYSSGSSGGIFGPSLYIGGMLGGVVGILAQRRARQPGHAARRLRARGHGGGLRGNRARAHHLDRDHLRDDQQLLRDPAR